MTQNSTPAIDKQVNNRHVISATRWRFLWALQWPATHPVAVIILGMLGHLQLIRVKSPLSPSKLAFNPRQHRSRLVLEPQFAFLNEQFLVPGDPGDRPRKYFQKQHEQSTAAARYFCKNWWGRIYSTSRCQQANKYAQAYDSQHASMSWRAGLRRRAAEYHTGWPARGDLRWSSAIVV